MPLSARQGLAAATATIPGRCGRLEGGAGQPAQQSRERGLVAGVEVVGDIERQPHQRQVSGH
jgi:hypothetical protein